MRNPFRGGWAAFKGNLFGHPKTTLGGLATGLGGLAALFGWHADPTEVGVIVSVIASLLGIFARDPGK